MSKKTSSKNKSRNETDSLFAVDEPTKSSKKASKTSTSLTDDDKIIIKNARSKIENLQDRHKGYLLINVTINGDEPFCKFSPFYPHGGFPVPGLEGCFSDTVEGVWQGLKIFTDETGAETPIDYCSFSNSSKKNLKRTVRKYGQVLGHKYGDRILGYIEARKSIYVPTYEILLNEKVVNELEELLLMLKAGKRILLLDYNTNSDVDDITKPLSHASLIRDYLINKISRELDQK